MKVVEFVKISTGVLKFLSENDVKVDGWRYVSMYERFVRMRKEGVKYSFVVSQLSEEYGVSRASVERKIKKLKKECKDIKM